MIEDDSRCIAKVCNAGIRAARGEILVTVDADSKMTPDSLREIRQMLRSGLYIGGGSRSRFDRMSLGIAVTAVCVAAHLVPVMLRSRTPLSGGMFWCYRRDALRIGGFDESLVSLEDMDFAVRLSRLGKRFGKKYGTLRRSCIVTSSRKFDTFGDWYLVRRPDLTRRLFTGHDREAADGFYYNVR
ncbi:MAG: glycosyltransferase [Oscillospiraceae bacterium]|nr:glycosyltransferase [Oscillospiraceae bacterium]